MSTIDISGHVCKRAAPVPAAPAPPAMMSAAAAAKKLAWYLRSKNPMDTDADAAAVPQADRQKWDTALSNFSFYCSQNDKSELFLKPRATIGSLTLGTFAAYRPHERNAVLNEMWNAIVIWVKGNKKATEMYDAAADDPVHFTSSANNRVSKAFTKLGVGFRCEKQGDLPRILREGFQPLYKNIAFAQSIGHYIGGTVMETRTRDGEMALWKKNQDAVGNTAICVARNLRGATKFPEAMYSGVVYAFAVKPSKIGCDTEEWQKSQGNQAVWRPGEKLFPSIPKDDVIAYTRVQKTAGGSEEHMWGFQFLDATWTYLKGTYDQRAYLDGELAAMRALGNVTTWVPKQDDFYKN